jgi:hypothetical protein
MKKMDASGDALSAILSDLSDKYIPPKCPFWELTMSVISWRKSD